MPTNNSSPQRSDSQILAEKGPPEGVSGGLPLMACGRQREGGEVTLPLISRLMTESNIRFMLNAPDSPTAPPKPPEIP